MRDRDAALAQLVDETESAEDWPQHEAYCQYVHATLTWFDRGCCEEVDVEQSVPCDDAELDYQSIEASECGTP